MGGPHLLREQPWLAEVMGDKTSGLRVSLQALPNLLLKRAANVQSAAATRFAIFQSLKYILQLL